MAFWLPAAIIGSSILGAGASINAGNKAAKATQQATDAATAEQRRQFDLARQDQMPWLQAGRGALDMRSQLLGLGGVGGAGGGNAFAQPADQWNQYLQANPDVMQAATAALQTPHMRNMGITTPQQFAEYHYNTHGAAEGRQLGQPMGGGAAGGSPGVVGVGGGAYMQGGDGQQMATAGPGGANDPYNAFLNSGYARSMLETNQADMDKMVGSLGAAGKSMSGTSIKALNDINRRNTANAFNMYDSALAGMSNTGQVTASAIGNAGMNMANNVGNMQMNAAAQRGSAYGNTANAINSGLQNATNVFAYGKGQGWF